VGLRALVFDSSGIEGLYGGQDQLALLSV